MSETKRSSFYWPMQCMSRRKREAMTALYTFCRAVDDVVDGNGLHKQERLQEWRDWIESIYEDKAVATLVPGLKEAITFYQLDKRHFLGIIEGMRMDADGPIIMPEYDVLERYCYFAASCVGLLTIQILGCNSQDHQQFAVELGHALQLTNIIRDVGVDAQMGRIYLATEWFEQAKLTSVTIEQIAQDPACAAGVCEIAANRASEHFERAQNYTITFSLRPLLPALLMRDVYFSLFTKMRKDQWQRRKQYKLSGSDTLYQLRHVPRYLMAS